jgi:aldehyde dehydrogenase (NAD(P)+)
MSATAQSSRPTPRPELDRAVAEVREKATEFARLPPLAKVDLLRPLIGRIERVSRGWVDAACRAKGITCGSATAGEEWLAGPVITLRNARLLVDSLVSIARRGKPPLGRGARTRADGRTEIALFPASTFDSILFAGFEARVLLEPGVDEKQARARQASFYQRKDPEGSVCAVLGAGNVASIPPTDVFHKMFVEGRVCVLKMNPVNEWLGPYLEQALLPLTERGYLRIVYGGGDAGAHLVEHAGVDDIHITGSDKTHDLIVWGAPGAERERRRAAGEPRLAKTISSELGNVSPVMIVPGRYSDDELWFQARNVATMVANNGSFNCNAAKMLVLGAAWPQRAAFLSAVERALGEAPLRRAYYPGAAERFRDLVGRRDQTVRIGQPREGELPWTLVRGLDVRAEDPLFRTEPFCGILSEAPLDANDPAEFLDAATRFCNDVLWGTLNATVIVPPALESDPTVGAALERAITELRYGTVAINHWPALGYGIVTPPWGGHPSATLADIQSGLGWVHNTFMLEGIDKTILRGPIVSRPKPAWFYDNPQTGRIGERLAAFEAGPGWLKLPAIAIAALKG